jgi:glycosyltransferase involved in cell wall biosynthesis
MKVLHVIPAVAPRYGGPSRAVLELAEALYQRGLTVEVWTTDADGAGRLHVPLEQTLIYQGVPCRFFQRNWSESFKFSHSLRTHIEQCVAEYDLVHIHSIFTYSTFAAAHVCWQFGIPYFISPHGHIEPWSMKQKRGRKWLAWQLVFREVCERAAAIIYTSERERRLTEDTLSLENGIVVPLGISEYVQASPRAAHRPMILSLSRIHRKKGIDLLVRAFTSLKIRGEIPEWNLTIAGDGDPKYLRELKQLAQAFASCVHWTGWLEGQAKFDIISASDIFALTSHQENFGISVLEAMACGVPALVSEQVGLSSVITQSRSGWVTELNQESICRALLEATRDAMERQARGKAARELVRREFGWPRVAQQTIAAYERTLLRGSISVRIQPSVIALS